MASSKLRTHQGKFISNNDGSRSTIMGLFQRDPAANQFQRLSRSLQSVRVDDGGVLTLVATDKAVCNWMEPHVLTPKLACAAKVVSEILEVRLKANPGNAITQAIREVPKSPSAVSEFVIDDNESEGGPSEIREVNLDGARHSIRGFYEL